MLKHDSKDCVDAVIILYMVVGFLTFRRTDESWYTFACVQVAGRAAPLDFFFIG
jgi:hypothetical protein